MTLEYIKYTLIITQIGIAVITDMNCYKVKNELVSIFAVLGLFYNISISSNYSGLLVSLCGLILPFIILLPLYILNMLGAGDIKLLCSIGALVGAREIASCIAISFLSGFFVSLAIMLYRGNFVSRMKKLFDYLKCSYICMSILPYDKSDKYSEGRMHFTIPIALGTLINYLL